MSTEDPNWGEQPTSRAVTQPLPVQQELLPNDTVTESTNTAPVTNQVTNDSSNTPVPPTILALLRGFAKLPNCSRYSSDSEKIKLLGMYLWLRQLVPTLPFETFLDLYAVVADFDKENLKHPDDAVKAYLPRSKKAAEEKGLKHWTAKEVVDFVALYVDMIREAERTQVPVPLTLNQFLQHKSLITCFVNGDFKEPEAPKASKGKKKVTQRILVTCTGQRCIYTNASQQQFRGYSQEVWQDEQTKAVFANFKSDEGEVFEGVSNQSLEVVDDPAPNPPQNIEGDDLPVIAQGKLLIRKAEFTAVRQTMGSPTTIGTVSRGDIIYNWSHNFPDGHTAIIHIVNGEADKSTDRPYVDAFMHDSNNNTVCELKPRENDVRGTYTFTISGGVYVLEVTGND